LSIPQKVRTGNVVMDANLRAALTQEKLLCPIAASVVHRMGLDSAGVVRLSPLSTKKIKGLMRTTSSWRASLIGCSIAQMGSLTTSSEKLNWRFESW
jgi:hypothetical protein